MTTVEVLRAARALIDTPEKWAKEYYAYDSDGATVDPESPDACKFCSLGAVYRFAEVGDSMEAAHALANVVPEKARVMARKEGSQFVPFFNDNPATTHADILALFDRAIANEVPS